MLSRIYILLSSRFPPTSAAQQVQRPPVPTPSRSIGAIESLIGRVQRNVSSSNPSPMRNRGVEPNSTMPYKVTYRQHSGMRPATISGRAFVKDIVMVDSSDEKVPRGHRRQCLHEAGLVVSFCRVQHSVERRCCDPDN